MVMSNGLEVTAVWQDGVNAPTELHIVATAGISSRALKAIRFSELLPEPVDLPPEVAMDLDQAGEWLSEHKAENKAPTPLTEQFMCVAALAYVLAIREGYKDAVPCVADLAGAKVNTANFWIARAREEGYLSSITVGRNGGRPHGRLTPKALEVLAR